MAITKFTTDTEVIQGLSDRPNSTDGLTADQLKTKYDTNGTNIKDYLNNTLTTEVDTSISTLTSAVALNTDKVTYPGSASASELNILDGATITTTELNYLDNVTSAVQTQLNAKLTASNNLSDVSSASTSRSNLGLGSNATRDITISTSSPSGGSSGDLWIKYS